MRPSRDEMLMDTAVLWAKRSTCQRRQVGCVISKDGRILVQGYNGAPAGQPHCNHLPTCRPETCGGTEYDPCDDWGSHASGQCSNAMHAEANAIAFAARHGVSLSGAILHTTLSPCLTCAMLVVNSGVVEVIYQEAYRDLAGVEYLSHSLTIRNISDSMRT